MKPVWVDWSFAFFTVSKVSRGDVLEEKKEAAADRGDQDPRRASGEAAWWMPPGSWWGWRGGVSCLCEVMFARAERRQNQARPPSGPCHRPM